MFHPYSQYKATESFSVSLPFAAIEARLLQANEARNAWVLHKHVRHSLPQEDKHFLQPKTERYFEKLSHKHGGVLLGAYAGTKLVGLAAMAKHKDLWGAFQCGGVTVPNARLLSQKYAIGPVAIVQAFCVSHDTISTGAASVLMDAVKRYARQEMFVHLFAQTAQDNWRGLSCFRKNGYASIADWQAPDHARFLLYRPVARTCKASWPAAIRSPA